MVLKYKNYIGVVEKIERIDMTPKYNIAIRDVDDVIIKFTCDIHDVKILDLDVIPNSYLFKDTSNV